MKQECIPNIGGWTCVRKNGTSYTLPSDWNIAIIMAYPYATSFGTIGGTAILHRGLINLKTNNGYFQTTIQDGENIVINMTYTLSTRVISLEVQGPTSTAETDYSLFVAYK